MNRGAWHQFGDRSQKLALEQLQNGAGVGVILSPRDLSYSKASEYVSQYAETGADILIDQQFHIPSANVGQLDSYPIASRRQAVSQLVQASDSDLLEVADALRETNSTLGTTALLAPAVVYEAGRSDIVDLNERLFATSRGVADELGIPCYATIFLGTSATNADGTTAVALSAATSLQADGWYYAFEFGADRRLPSSAAQVARYLKTGLALATTGLPVLHGYVGPMAPLALACGGTAAAIGHSQNLWQFTRARWEPAPSVGGGGDAPPRYFSQALWGTLIYEDEWALLPQAIREQVYTPTPFSSPVRTSPPFLPWDRWSANKHLVNAICETVESFAQMSDDAELILDAVSELLATSVSLHTQIHDLGFELRDDTASYQAQWRAALQSIKTNQADDFELLRLLS